MRKRIYEIIEQDHIGDRVRLDGTVWHPARARTDRMDRNMNLFMAIM